MAIANSETLTLSLLVSEYLDLYGDSYEEEDLWWGNKELTWDEAISRAWMSRLQNGKMHGHQCLVANKLPEGLTISRIDNKQKEDFKDFQNLYDWVKSVTFRVKGLGATTAYDVARRLGAWLGLKPIMVYLHAATSAGAKKFGIKGDITSLSKFPKEIQYLDATHVENFLCIYKDHITLQFY